MNELRWVLVGLAVLTIVGLYAFSRVRRAQEDRRFWAGHQIPDPDATPSVGDDGDTDQTANETGTLEPAIDSGMPADPTAQSKNQPTPVDKNAAPTADYAAQMDSISVNQKDNAPEMTVVHYLVRSNNALFDGPTLYREAEKAGLVFGPMDTLDMVDADSGKVMFSLANAVGDGKIPKGELDDFSTPGLVLFMRLPGPCAGVKSYYQMLACAGQFVEAFEAEVLDEDRAKLNEQGARHNQDRIANFDARQKVA